jgi:predicted metalloprotease with PDZ domain
VQVKHGLIPPQEYLNVLYEKMLTADQFIDDVPFTDISRFTLDKYHDQYYNVYQKGALIAMCIDIKLLKLSNGEYDLRKLMLDLSGKFGKDKAFKDDELFDVITKMTFPEIGEFFAKYVAGNKPLPFAEVFQDVGILYQEEEAFEDYSLGITNADVGLTEVDSKPRLQIVSTDQQNEMGKALGFFEGDVLVAINDEDMPDLGPELGVFIQKQMQSLPVSDSLSYTVLRKNAEGELEERRLSAPVKKIEMVRRHLLMPDPEATEDQLRTRDAWLKE